MRRPSITFLRATQLLTAGCAASLPPLSAPPESWPPMTASSCTPRLQAAPTVGY